MGNNYGVDSKKDFRSANVNVIFYDKGIISDFETHLNFLSVKKIVKGALFGTDNSELFFRVIELIKNSEAPPFILIISGSLAEEILPKIHDETFLYDVLIFCFNKNKYSKLQTQFPKVKMIESMDFDNILQFLKSKNYILAQNKKGAKFLKNVPLITFSEYENYYYQYHHIIAENFCKDSLKLEEKDKSNFLYYVPSNRKKEAKNILDNLKNDKTFRNNIINIYTKESPICYVLNRELRLLDPCNYNYIKKYACSTLYSLYKYYELNKKKDDKKKKQEIEDSLYAMQLQDEDARLPSPIGQEIAYEGENVVDGDENVVEVVQKIVDCVDLIIENNDENNEYPSAINISALSDKNAEEERLFPAFSFFKIKKVEIRTGSKEKPHRIFLEVVNKKYNLEQRIYAGERVYLDSKTNLLMTRKFVNE